ncbi:hypothetical protein GS480_00100 [Rhodococcus hoagii]|nr:hypothetical protein [Prescottella equi]
MRPPAGLPSLSKRTRVLLILALIAAALLLVGPRFIDVYTDWLWFGEVRAYEGSLQLCGLSGMSAAFTSVTAPPWVSSSCWNWSP